MTSPTPKDVLAYWFGALDGPLDFPKDKNALWWSGGASIDAEIRERFGSLVEQALVGGLTEWEAAPNTRLALVLVLDQFTRSIGRGTPRAFAGDARAQKLVLGAIEQGLDEDLRPIERAFLYMPLMHAEDRTLAKKSLEMFAEVSRVVAKAGVEGYPDFVEHAIGHAKIVERFGRYPHRNRILGRDSTPEEQAYLADGAPSFGQGK
ncbi:MAG: DUF924 family protein [Polyangiales bacterium]|nr:DUF924 domain-containing protein [Myxococcales bacterium]